MTELDGFSPTHDGNENGTTKAKRRLLQRLGWKVVNIRVNTGDETAWEEERQLREIYVDSAQGAGVGADELRAKKKAHLLHAFKQAGFTLD